MREIILWKIYSHLNLPPPLSVSDADYTSVSMILIITTGTTISAGGNLIPTVMIMTSTDSIVETQEMFTLSLTSTDSAVMPQSVSRTVSITDMTSEYIHSHTLMSMTNIKETAKAISRPVADSYL